MFAGQPAAEWLQDSLDGTGVATMEIKKKRAL